MRAQHRTIALGIAMALVCADCAAAQKAAAPKYVLTVKHTEGDALWDSAHTSHDITAFRNFKGGKGDIVREFMDACRSRALRVGFYSYEFPWKPVLPDENNRLPAEVCDTIQEKSLWFWKTGLGENDLQSAEQVAAMLRKCNARGANYNLNVPPDREGRISGVHLQRMVEIGRLTGGSRKTQAPVAASASCEQVLSTDGGRLVVVPEGETWRVELRGDDGIQLAQPLEGLWSIAMGWSRDWPTDWKHAQPIAAKRVGPWLALSGRVATGQGDWLVRDAYAAKGRCICCVRRWQWTGKQPARRVTLSVRWQAPAPNAKVMMPGFCYYGNPSGSADRVPKFFGKPGEELFCEEHRLPMPFAALEWEHSGRFHGAALHMLPSLTPYAASADQWWSVGVTGQERLTELALLSGPCSLNGSRGFVKANQHRWLPYTDTHLTVPSGAVIEKTFFLQTYPVERQGSGFFVPMRQSLDLWRPFSMEGLPTLQEIIEAKYRYSLSRWHESARAAGFQKYPPSQVSRGHSIVMGWSGQADAPCYAFLVLAERLQAPKAVTMAQRAMDFLTTSPMDADGFMVWYDADKDAWSRQEMVAQGQAMEDFARAILAGRKLKSVDTSKWEAFLRRACDVHAARILNEDWRPKSTSEAFLVAPLCKASSLFDVDSYRRAAIKAATHYAARHLDMTEPYWGGTLDASCEDKEGAWAAFQAFLAVYEMTRDPRRLQWAEHAMNVTLTYTFVWDIAMPPGRLRDHDLKTRGWTAVSAQNQHLDVFGVLYTPEIYRMGVYLHRDDLKKLAAVMYRSCGQMIDPEGGQGEQFNHTNFAQLSTPIEDARRMRGTYNEDWTVFWITAHFLNAAAQFQEMGVSLDQ